MFGGLRERAFAADPSTASDPFGLASREEILQRALEILEYHDQDIRAVFGEDIQYGIRGSLSTGIRFSSGDPFDPTNFDVDAFVISQDVPPGFSRLVMPNTMEVTELEQTIDRELRSLEGFEGLRPELFGFRNWRREQPGSTMCGGG